MAKQEAEITGAVAIGRRVYKAGDEEDFRAALTSEEGKSVDLAVLEAAGAVRGFTGAASTGSAGAAKAEPEADKPKAKK